MIIRREGHFRTADAEQIIPFSELQSNQGLCLPSHRELILVMQKGMSIRILKTQGPAQVNAPSVVTFVSEHLPIYTYRS